MLFHLGCALTGSLALGGACARPEPGPPPAPVVPMGSPPPSSPPPRPPSGGCGTSCVGAGDPFDGGPSRFDASVVDGGRPRDARVMVEDVPGRDRCEYAISRDGVGAACRSVCGAGLECAPLASVRLDPIGPRAWGEPRCTSECLDEAGCSCGTCVHDVPYGPSRLEVDSSLGGLCAPRCTPQQADRGDCLAGSTCDPWTRTCVPACEDDADCRVARVGPGMFALDDRPELTCDRTTGRCVHVGPVDARLDDRCGSDLDCPTSASCWWPRGREELAICVVLGCTPGRLSCSEDHECRDGVCLARCVDNAGCPAGYACDAGTCTPGCLVDGDCEAGERCGSDGRCVVDEPDAGELDAGELDAGEPDAGEPDAGDDAGELDAGA